MKTFRFKTVSRQLLGDLDTPVSIYLKVRDIFPQSALLESSDFHSHENARSYIALCPIANFGVNNSVCTSTLPDGSKKESPVAEHDDVQKSLNEFLHSFDIEGEDKDECGLFGYTAFDAIKYLEDIPVMENHHKDNDAPDILYIMYKYVIRFDHFKNEIKLVELLEEGEQPKLQEIETIIKDRNYASYNFTPLGAESSTITDEQYIENVKKGIKHCLRGDVFQIVLSRRFEQKFKGDDFKVYRALRSINPSPYLFYFDFGGFRIFGSSPETHCKINAGHASIDPIAGTAFRSGDTIIDKKRVEALIADPKENAEHVMLVDLARNDLSRNASHVSVDFYKEVQHYSHVMHLVSRVSGDINQGSNPVKTYIDTFPAGTLGGAPKVRAMELITDIEHQNRGAYGGCIGFIGFNGDLNQAITIRSFVSRGNTLYYQAGAGIVAKSKPERELQEVNNKLGALKKAIDLAATLIN
jgi:anthranilate synthase component 1